MNEEVIKTKTDFMTKEIRDIWLGSGFSYYNFNMLSNSGLLEAYFDHH